VTALDLCGGDPALDFVNTLGGAREGPWDDEWLPSYRELATWSAHAGLLPGPTAGLLLERAAARPREAHAAHAEALAMREAVYAVAAALAHGASPAADALAAVAAAHRAALAHARLAPREVGLDWTWDDGDLRRPLWPLALASVDLLRSDRLARLKQCSNCRWLFLDASKNRSRRWCSMAHCGVEAKVRLARAHRRAA
jgi:predicted RNA-binding Zn ribbon-like protein